MTTSQQTSNHLTALLLAFCGMAAAVIVFNERGAVNNDTVLYLEVARLFSQAQWQQGFDLYGWPFYPLIIAALHAVTAFDLLVCAQILNVAFFTLTAYFVIRLIHVAGGTQRVALAGVALLIGSPYIAGDVLAMLLRDEGFWAFYLGGLYFLAQYFVHRRWRDAWLWQVCITLAALFRIEGIVFQLLLPLVVAVCHRETRPPLRHLLMAYSLTFIAAVTVIAWRTHPSAQWLSTNRLGTMLQPGYFKQALALFQTRTDVMRTEVLGHYLDDEAAYTLFFGLCLIVLKKIVVGGGVLHLLLAGYGYRPRTQLREAARITLDASVVIGILLALAIIVHTFVLSGRHLAPVLLPLIIYAAFGINRLIDGARQRNNKRARILAALIGFCLTVGIVLNLAPRSRGHDYELRAAAWVKEHNPDNKPVLYSSYRLRYYAGVPFIGRWQDEDTWGVIEAALATQTPEPFAYVVLSVSRKDQPRLDEFLTKHPDLREVFRFMGPRNKRMALILSNARSSPAPRD